MVHRNRRTSRTMVRLIPWVSGLGSPSLLVSIFLTYIMAVPWTSAAGQEREFIFTFPTNSHQSRVSNDKAHLYLTATSLEAGITSVNISIVSSEWNHEVEIPARHKGVTVVLPPEAEAEGSGFQNSAILVRATRDISLLALSERNGSTGSFLVRSTENLGTEYFVLSYAPIQDEWSEFTVSATEDDTEVSIQLEARLLFENTPYGREEMHVSLSRWQTAQFQSRMDLTGSHIRANKPISVVAGSSASSIPIESGPPGYVVEHLPPLGALGTKYVLAPILGRSSGFECVVVAGCTTTVSAFGEKVFLYPGDSYRWDAPADSIAVITSSQPILVAQFSKSASTDRPQNGSQRIGGPALIIVPPIDNLNTSPDVTFSTPPLPRTAYYHVSVTARCNKISRLKLNQSPLNPNRQYNNTGLNGICVVQKQLRLTNLNSTLSINQVPSSRHPFAVSVLVHGNEFPSAYAISSINQNTNASFCQATSSDDSFLEESMSSSDDYITVTADDFMPQPLSQDGGTTIHSRGANRNTTVPESPQTSNTITNVTTHPDAQNDSSLSSSVITTPAYLTNLTENAKSTIEENNSLNSETTVTTSTRSTGRTSTSVNIPTPVPTVFEQPTNSTISTKVPLETTDPSTRFSNESSTAMQHETTSTDRTDRATDISSSTPGVSTNSTHSTSSVTTTYTYTEPEDETTNNHLSTAPLNYSVSTWLAETLTVTSTGQTTQKEDETICATCSKPIRILMYGGIAIAALLVLCIFICIVKIIHSRRYSKKFPPKTSLWAAYPVKVSAEELSLSRLNVTHLGIADKPDVKDSMKENIYSPVNGDSRCTSAVFVEVSAGGDTADFEENAPVHV